jgi:hypothetical protein
MSRRKATSSRRKASTSARGDTYLQLDRISGSSDLEVQAFYDKVYAEEFEKYEAWLEANATSDGQCLRVAAGEADKEFMKALDRVHARAGYRFIHLLSPRMQKRLREVYPQPPQKDGNEGQSFTFDMAG